MVTKTKPFIFRWQNYSIHSHSSNRDPPWVADSPLIIEATDTVAHGGPVRGYKQLISRGSDATSSLTGTRTTVKFEPGRALQRVDQGNGLVLAYGRSGDVVSTSLPGFPGSGGLTSADNQAISSFMSKARDAQRSFDGLVFAGELEQTMKMILGPGQAFRRGLTDYLSVLRKNRRGTRQHRRKVLSGTWLEFSFGWKPLINDINAAAKALATDYSLRQQIAYVTASGKSEFNFASSIGTLPVGAAAIDFVTQSWHENIVVYRGGVYTRVSNPTFMSARNLGFSLDNFVPSAWELIPYSFLVDYFTNIGDILSAWSFSNSNFSWKNRTVILRSLQKKQSVAFRPFSISSPQKLISQSYESGRSEVEVRTVNRVPSPNALIPTLEFSRPEWSSLKWLNLAALADQHRSLRPYF